MMKMPKMINIIGILCLFTTTAVQGQCEKDDPGCTGQSTMICQFKVAKESCPTLCGDCKTDPAVDCQDKLLCGGLTEKACNLDPTPKTGVKANCPVLCKETVNAKNCGEGQIEDCTADKGFEKVNSLCLKFSTNLKTWSKAKEECESLDGILLEEKDLGKISTYMLNTDKMTKQYWVGASDQKADNPGKYKWIIGGEPITDDLWLPGAFNPAAGVAIGKSCVTLWVTTTVKGLVAIPNTDCFGPGTHRYICQEIYKP